MAGAIEVRVPNIGDFKDVPVIEVLIKPGDVVKAEDPLITVESEKASMEVPSPSAGTVESVSVKVGDKVSEGTAILMLAAASAPAAGPDSSKRMGKRVAVSRVASPPPLSIMKNRPANPSRASRVCSSRR